MAAAAAAALGGRHCHAFASSFCSANRRSKPTVVATALQTRRNSVGSHARSVLQWQQLHCNSGLQRSSQLLSSQQLQYQKRPRQSVVTRASAAAASGSGDADPGELPSGNCLQAIVLLYVSCCVLLLQCPINLQTVHINRRRISFSIADQTM
jgi:hypothetical protein